METTGVNYDEAVKYLNLAQGHVKTALVMILTGTTSDEANFFLHKADGFIKKAVDSVKKVVKI